MTNKFEPLINEESLSGGADPHKQVEEKMIECDDADWDEEYFQKHCQHAPERKSRLQPWAVYVIRLHNPEQYSQLESIAENKLGRSLRKYEKAAFFRDPVFMLATPDTPTSDYRSMWIGKIAPNFWIFIPHTNSPKSAFTARKRKPYNKRKHEPKSSIPPIRSLRIQINCNGVSIDRLNELAEAF